MNGDEGLRQAVETAMNAELEGRRFYRSTALKSTNPVMKGIFESLARSEEYHIDCIGRISRGKFNLLPAPAAAYVETEKVFAELIEQLRDDALKAGSDLEALDIAMELEHHACDFYSNWAARASDNRVRAFCERMAAEETDHLKLITGIKEFLVDPRGRLGSG